MNSKLNGTMWKLFNLIIFSVITVLGKFISTKVHPFTVYSLSMLFSLFLLLIIKFTSGIKVDFKIDKVYITRALLNVLGLSSWFYALNITSAIEASAISFTTPLVAIIIACMFTKEKMSIISVTSLLLAMFGALMLVSPDHININSGNLLALFSALIWAIHDVICKIQARKEHLFSQIIITFSLVSVLSLPLNLFSDFLPTISDIYVIALMGFLFVLNLYCLTKSYAATDLVVVMPLSFLRLVFTAILSYIFIGEVIAQESFNACLIIILGSMLSIIPNIYQYITKKV